MITALREMIAGKRITARYFSIAHDTTKLTSRISDLRKIIELSENKFVIHDEAKETKLDYSRYYLKPNSIKSAKILLKKLEGKK